MLGCADTVQKRLDRGDDYFDSEQWDKAIGEYSQAIELDPNFAIAYKKRGVTYGLRGQYNLAIADFSKTIELDAGDAKAYYGRAWAYTQKGQRNLASADLNKVIELSTDPVLVQLAQQGITMLEPLFDGGSWLPF